MSLLPLVAQDNEDIGEFFKRGQACYDKRDLEGAALEFENVLMLDPGHLEAKIWLVKVYGDRKDFRKAQDMLKLAQNQAPKNSEVQELLKMYGLDKPAKVTKKEPDLVRHETMTLLGLKQTPRQYGLVIPEERIHRPVATVSALVELGMAPDEGDQASGTLGGQDPSKALSALSDKKEEGPLAEVFDVWALEGLNPALEKYFEIVGGNKARGLYDDQNLLREGYNFFKPRYEANSKDEEARYFFGMITFFNGDIQQANDILTPIRISKFCESLGARYVFGEFDRIKAMEDARLAAIKKAEEEKEARRLAAEQAKRDAAEAAAAAAAAAAAKASGTATTGETGTQVAAAPGSPEAIDNDGYDLYKKGQLDPAIEKYQQAIKLNANDPKIHYHLGLAMTDKALAGSMESFDRAVEAFNNVMRLSPGSKLARDAEIMIRDISAAKNSMKP